MAKLRFNITEIPEGESRQELTLGPDDLDTSPYDFEGGNIIINFDRTRHFIRTEYVVNADVELVCERSLEPFMYSVSTRYDVIFKTGVEEETEDEDGAVRRFNFSSNSFSIEKEVRDSVMLEIPIQKIHPRFLDDDGNREAFETKKFGEKHTQQEQQQTNPRWEKLKELKDNN